MKTASPRAGGLLLLHVMPAKAGIEGLPALPSCVQLGGIVPGALFRLRGDDASYEYGYIENN
jgi:hypothetical protein